MLSLLLIGFCMNSARQAAQSDSDLFVKGAYAAPVLARCGTPDADDSTAYDKPRPLIVTRLLTYEAQRVRAIYVPDVANSDVPPPYDRWKLVGLTDPKSQTSISSREAATRMAVRCK
jgi:hypothetical protein